MSLAENMRYKILKAMDKTIRCHSGDEDYIMMWLAEGIPDDSTEEDFRSFAQDPYEYEEFIETFHKILDIMDKDAAELPKTEMIEKFISYI